MGLGILPDRYLGDKVPGTSLLDDTHSGFSFRGRRQSAIGDPESKPKTDTLKRNKDGIILVPQPSDSPNDPLNWPRWRKVALMVTVSYGAGVVGAFGPIISVGLVQVAETLNTSVDALSKITGDLILAIGLVLLLTAPASVVWGRRPVYLAGNVLLLISSIWSAASKDLGNLTASRVIGGMGMAPIECLVEATIADIFFVHERGLWIAIWSFALLGGINGVSIVNGFIIQDVSFRAAFAIEAGLVFVLLILTILFVPETAYNRPDVSTIDERENSNNGVGNKSSNSIGSRSSSDKPPKDEKAVIVTVPPPAPVTPITGSMEDDTKLDKDEDGTTTKLDSKEGDIAKLGKTDAITKSDTNLSTRELPETPKTFMQLLKPWEGKRFTEQSFFKVALRPLAMLCSPPVAWATLMYGTNTAWIVALSVSVSLLFSSPQFGYNFQPGKVGLISGVGPLLLSLAGNALAGPLSDWTIRVMSRRNGGVYEPEFRLLMVIPLLIFNIIGWFGWAVSADRLLPFIAPTIFFSLINFGQAMGSIAVVGYVVDAHEKYAAETFAIINAIKNIFTFGITWFVIPWLTGQGVYKTFCTIGGLTIFICCTTIPMYIYGKRARSWVHRTPWVLA